MARGVFEPIKGSGIWYTRYADATGRIRREKAGSKSMAKLLYQKRKTEALQGKKLPETIRRKGVKVSDLLEMAAQHVDSCYRDQRLGADGNDYRYGLLKDALGNRPADGVTPGEIERCLSRLGEERKWSAASFNRYKAFLSLAYRLGVENENLATNPARLVRRRHEDNGVIRWLTAGEENKLRAMIESDYPDEMPAFELALHTGMRRSEQYRLAWNFVDLDLRQIAIPKSKHGDARYIPLDQTALAALLTLRNRGKGIGPVMVAARNGHGHLAGHPLKTPKEWFESAVTKAGIASFTWHCLRHSFASRLVMAGVDLRKVQELMGHKTIAMTCRYSHLAPRHLHDAVSKLDDWDRVFGVATDARTDIDASEPSRTRLVVSKQVVLQ